MLILRRPFLNFIVDMSNRFSWSLSSYHVFICLRCRDFFAVKQAVYVLFCLHSASTESWSPHHLAVGVSSVVMTPMHGENQLKKQTNTNFFIAIQKVNISTYICVIIAQTHAKVLVCSYLYVEFVGSVDLSFVSSMMNMFRTMICTSLSVDKGSGDLLMRTRNWSRRLPWATGKSSVSICVYNLPAKNFSSKVVQDNKPVIIIHMRVFKEELRQRLIK